MLQQAHAMVEAGFPLRRNRHRCGRNAVASFAMSWRFSNHGRQPRTQRVSIRRASGPQQAGSRGQPAEAVNPWNWNR